MKTFREQGGMPALVAVLVILVLSTTLAFGAALTTDRSSPRREGASMSVGVAIANKIFAGSMVAINSDNYAVRASADSTLRVIGRAESQQDNTSGAAGDLNIEIGTGIYLFANAVTFSKDDIGKTVYVVDDQTVDLSDLSGARPAAGRVYDVDSTGQVWVNFGTEGSTAASGAIALGDHGAGAVNSSDILDLDIATGDLAPDLIDGTKVADDAISLEHLDTGITPSHIIVFANTMDPGELDADGIVAITHSGVLATDEAWGIVNSSTNPVAINNSATSTDTVTFIMNSAGGSGTTIHYWVTRAAQ